MTALLTQVGEVLTAMLGWAGDTLTFVVTEPLLLLPLAIGLGLTFINFATNKAKGR